MKKGFMKSNLLIVFLLEMVFLVLCLRIVHHALGFEDLLLGFFSKSFTVLHLNLLSVLS